ncbi:MAG TPA: 1-acyl-sn-glycerol-3-phosphate acyltransferase [Vicinamibacterales bacterium]
MLDEVSQAVLSREEILKFPRDQVNAFLEELRTTQRHKFYRALQHPLYPILRKIERKHEHLHYVTTAARTKRIVYASNHKSHTDYLVEPLVLDDNGIRPPLIAAGINLFGGPLGLIHKHVTGAIPIRRNMKDLAYLTTLKAYVAEILKKHDLFFYPEGGRSYSGELKPAKTGLFNAALSAERPDLVVIPVAVAYDLVLEDHILAHQSLKRRQRPFGREVAEMVRYAVGYRSRAFVTFGAPIDVGDRDGHSRSDVLELARLVRARTGMLYKVLPTALFAAAMRPSLTRRDLESRIDSLIEELSARHANLGVTSGRQAIEEAAEPLETRGIIVAERGRFRVRERTVLRYYARTIEHLLTTTGRTH